MRKARRNNSCVLYTNLITDTILVPAQCTLYIKHAEVKDDLQ